MSRCMMRPTISHGQWDGACFRIPWRDVTDGVLQRKVVAHQELDNEQKRCNRIMLELVLVPGITEHVPVHQRGE